MRVLFLVGVLLVVTAILFFSSAFILEEGKQAVVTQFKRPVKFVDTPGLKFKVPFLQAVEYFEKKILPWDGAPENMQTKDTMRIYVDCWARWKIVDLETFYINVRTEQKGQKILDDIVDSVVRDVVAANTLIDLVRTTNDKLIYEIERPEISVLPTGEKRPGSSNAERTKNIVTTGRDQIEKDILKIAGEGLAEEYGIELVAVHIKRVKYNDTVRNEVYHRMKSERGEIAKSFQSQAEKMGNQIKGWTNKELDQIVGQMTKRSQEIRGEADATVINLTAEAYGQNPEFYEFLQQLELYKNALKRDTSLVLSTNSDMFKMFKSVDPKQAAQLDKIQLPPELNGRATVEEDN